MPLLAPVLLPTHERWFVESRPAGDWSFFFSPLPLALTAAVVVVTVAWRFVALRVRGPELRVLQPLEQLVPWVPRLLGIHLGVALLALAATGAFLTPSIDHLDGVVGASLLLLEAALGVWLVTGVRLRPAAGLVLALGPALAVVAGPVALGECANLAAVAAFLLVLPPSADAHGAVRATPAQLRLALLLLRLGVGAALIVLAFSEKLTNPAMAIDTLERYPALDVFALVGLDVAPATFVAVAGATELLFGLLVLSCALPQVAVLVAMVPFNATLLIFGQTEMVGHLPVYGVFLALLVYGSSPVTAEAVRWLPRADLRPRRSAVGDRSQVREGGLVEVGQG
ncbi:hypothetical protein [Nocardioides perillae]|uniref:DoxX protein n=1 Tax=Nocardioides perillae TaxID=1119534 RepID=A0A7Y9UKQ6_9ACTN|nr:hypothetical protein [Nocardioides perillae]NYG55633.1 hypothetical protein [Nocardioides perillae]